MTRRSGTRILFSRTLGPACSSMLAESPNRTAAISIASVNGVPAVRGATVTDAVFALTRPPEVSHLISH
jgi:hypothetical protein